MCTHIAYPTTAFGKCCQSFGDYSLYVGLKEFQLKDNKLLAPLMGIEHKFSWAGEGFWRAEWCRDQQDFELGNGGFTLRSRINAGYHIHAFSYFEKHWIYIPAFNFNQKPFSLNQKRATFGILGRWIRD